MSGHTPGPWLAMRGTEITGRQVVDWAVSDNIDSFICTGPTWDDEHEEESFANARLIAAAPDLLEALQDIISWIPNEAAMARLGFLTEFPELSRKKAVAAIAKAITTTPESN